jgi:hypothetical protein
VPFTFLAHQAPVLPLVRRPGTRWDGVALVAGSVAPDLAYVTRGWGFGPWGMKMWFDGHRPQNILVVAIGASLLACVVRYWILPVLPLALPRAGPFHLRDLRHVSNRRPRWWATLGSALVGALTHVVLDAFTHADGSVVEVGGPLQAELFDVGDRTVRVYSLLQYGGSVVLAGYTVWWFWRAGTERRFRPADPAARAEPGFVLSTRAIVAFWLWMLATCVVAVAYAQTRAGYHYAFNRPFYGSTSVVVISFCWVAFIGLTFACLAAQPFVHRSPRFDVATGPGGSVAA